MELAHGARDLPSNQPDYAVDSPLQRRKTPCRPALELVFVHRGRTAGVDDIDARRAVVFHLLRFDGNGYIAGSRRFQDNRLGLRINVDIDLCQVLLSVLR